MFKARKTRVMALTGAGLAVAATVLAGAAVAAPDASTSQAPHAQAGAQINADGTVVHSKGVKGVTASGHVYCVEIENEDVDLSRAIVTATPRNTPGSTLRVIPGNCAGGKGITVGTYDPSGGGLPNAFYIAVM
ncbi:hypothetical protein ABT390_16625 [Streptomyces aurantiacus]|uniref:Secreted protein n=1 Tax=Streptomyces aurantiacus JA 4570 TaxID=1286094 RepID=S3ZC70_9ACTN|nr:hypothetical protein [Streptomyces aurantiacus]EPH40214.1 hypothetical protein STRAU_6708 [Streptomyces aurantiacus JA 4570]